MSNKKTIDPKTTARIVRLALEFSRQLEVLQAECGDAEDLTRLAYELGDSSRDIQRKALLVPGIKIAVFPENEEPEKGGAK